MKTVSKLDSDNTHSEDKSTPSQEGEQPRLQAGF
jgi:hypothetical protein